MTRSTIDSRDPPSKGPENATVEGMQCLGLLFTYSRRDDFAFLALERSSTKMTLNRVPMFAAIMAAGLFIAATLHHSRENLRVPDAIKSWTFRKSASSALAVCYVSN